ncbi:MAG: hypothetical protein KGD72_00175 [Candidatus Lokiarchaeota archaeon]|nr:hypothetical protein [Candidatus Lokiarchaeota archaeon]
MEDVAIKKDETPYLIFACRKCREFSYVKTTQKSKKCLRCGRSHQVSNILKEAEVVFGMTEAVNTVKRKQNEFALPEFRSGSDFVVATHKVAKPINSTDTLKNNSQEIDYKFTFNKMLIDLSRIFKRFPSYMLEIMAEDYKIPTIELKTLIRSAEKSGMLIKNGDDDMYYMPKKK